MSSLVQFLASGVNGAENGSATFVLRGTASSAASVLWSDFEQTSQPGTNIITLDANGAAEIYCTAYVDVTIKNSAGSTLRTVTFGNSATTVEVVSDSFTGTNYAGSPSGVSLPITLAAVMDKWNNSAGSIDWKVLVNGVSTNISSAFSALAGIFFNVKDPTYGAVGDGVTDDTTAIGLAIAAANSAGGGVVYFPSGTYKYTTLTLSNNNITLMGSGAGASTLTSSSTSTNFTISATGNTKLSDLAIVCTSANANPVIQLNAGVRVLMERCDITASSISGRCIRKTSGSTATNITMRNCKVVVGSDCGVVVENAADDSSVKFRIIETRFEVGSSFHGYGILGPDFQVNQCIFDASNVASAFYVAVNPVSNGTAGKYLGNYTNNQFLDGGGASAVCFELTSIASSTDFYENGNRFVGFAAPADLVTADKIYHVSHGSQASYRMHLGSRIGRNWQTTYNSTGTIEPLAFCSYESIYINYGGAGSLTIQAPNSVVVAGAECTLVLGNNSGAMRTITIDYGETPNVYGPLQSTSGSDLALTPNNGERVIAWFKFMNNSGGEPLAFAPVPVTD